MSLRYRNLLSPLRIGNVVLKNRFTAPNATPHFLQGPEEYPAEPYLNFFYELAKNGAAVINIGDLQMPGRRDLPDWLDFSHSLNFDLKNPANQNYMCQLADVVHLAGSLLLVNPRLAFPKGYSYLGGPTLMQSSTGIMPGPKVEPLPKERFPEVIEPFMETLKKYRSWGFDGIGIRCDHFLTAGEDVRTDEYGGSNANRARLLIELFARIKKELGPDFIIEGVLAGEQPHGYQGGYTLGYTLDDAIEFAKLTEGYIDILQIREKDMTIAHPTGYTHSENEHKVLDYARAMKAAGVKTILAPNGGFQNPDLMERMLSEGVCDMFSVARGFYSDPEYGQKLYGGRGEAVTPCIKCNKCHGILTTPWLSYCSVNPLLGLGTRAEQLTSPAKEKKNVAVIGGGPIGMRAAIYCARRGHKVTLFERSDYLGGQLKHADVYRFKWPIKKLRLWLIRELGVQGVDVRLNCEPTPAELSALGFDAIIAATGAKAKLPDIPGMKKKDGTAEEGIYTCHDVFAQKVKPGKRVVIVGCSEVGIETAIHLAQNGHEVTCLTRQKELAHDASKLHYITISHVKIDPKTNTGYMAPEWLKYDNLSGITEVTTTCVTPTSVTYVGKDGEKTIECDTVVVCGGVEPEIENALRYSGIVSEFYLTGDVCGCKNLQNGFRNALGKAALI